MNQDRGMRQPSRRSAGAPRWRWRISRLSALALLAPALASLTACSVGPNFVKPEAAVGAGLARGRSALDQDQPRGLPRLVGRLPRPEPEPAGRHRLRSEPDPDGGRRARSQGEGGPRPGDRRGLSAGPAAQRQADYIQPRAPIRRPTPTTRSPRSSGASISAARSPGKSTLGQVPAWRRIRRRRLSRLDRQL